MIDYPMISKLSELLSSYYGGNEELQSLVMTLGEAPDNLVNDNKSPRINAQEIGLYMARRNRLDELLNLINTTRPDIDLSSVGFSPPSGPGKPTLPGPPPKPPAKEKLVYISYAWGGTSEEFVNKLDEAFQEKGLNLVRDKRDLGYKGSISEFMREIGRAGAIVVVINDKYLKSPNCMYELTEIAGNQDFRERVFPVVMSDADIYKPVNRIQYVQYWEQEIKALDEAMKTVSSANLQGFREEIDSYQNIRNTISELVYILKDMNTLTPDMHRDGDFQVIYDEIQKRL